MATSTYGSANGGLTKSSKAKSVKSIASLASEKQGSKQKHAQVYGVVVVVSSGCVCYVFIGYVNIE